MNPAQREDTRRYIERLDRGRRTLAEEVEPDIELVRGLSLEERGAWVARLSRSAWMILRARPDFHEVLAHSEPPAPDWPEKWRAMNARLRARHAALAATDDRRNTG